MESLLVPPCTLATVLDNHIHG